MDRRRSWAPIVLCELRRVIIGDFRSLMAGTVPPLPSGRGQGEGGVKSTKIPASKAASPLIRPFGPPSARGEKERLGNSASGNAEQFRIQCL